MGVILVLTINEIKNKKFEKAAFGYKVEDVETFLNSVIDFAVALENEKAEMQSKLVVLANKIEEYRNEEDSLRQALLGAQKLGDSILKEAKNRAEIIMRDATIKSENIVKNVKDEVKREEVILNKMKREVDAFRSKMLTMYGTHIDMIKSIPEIEREKEEEKPEINEEPVAETVVETVEEKIEAPETVEETVEVKEEVIETVEEKVEETALTEEDEIAETLELKVKAEEDDEGFKISGGFKFSRDDEPKKESKFGPLKFGDGYELDE